MIRTRFRLTEQEYRAARGEAERLGISLTELVRQSLRCLIQSADEPAWMRYAGMVNSATRSGPSVDEVVYGGEQ